MSRPLGHIKRKRNLARRQRRHQVERINRTQAVVGQWTRPLELTPHHQNQLLGKRGPDIAGFGGYLGVDGHFHTFKYPARNP